MIFHFPQKFGQIDDVYNRRDIMMYLLIYNRQDINF